VHLPRELRGCCQDSDCHFASLAIGQPGFYESFPASASASPPKRSRTISRYGAQRRELGAQVQSPVVALHEELVFDAWRMVVPKKLSVLSDDELQQRSASLNARHTSSA